MDVVAGNSGPWPESQPEIERDVLEHKTPAILTRQKRTISQKTRELDSTNDMIAVSSEWHTECRIGEELRKQRDRLMSWAGRSCAGTGRGVTCESRDVILFMYFCASINAVQHSATTSFRRFYLHMYSTTLVTIHECPSC